MQQNLEESTTFARRSGSAHSRYLELFRCIREHDEEIKVYLQIVMAISAGVVRRMELNSFSDETLCRH